MGRWIDGKAGETEGLCPTHDREAAENPSTILRLRLRMVPLPIRKRRTGRRRAA